MGGRGRGTGGRGKKLRSPPPRCSQMPTSQTPSRGGRIRRPPEWLSSGAWDSSSMERVTLGEDEEESEEESEPPDSDGGEVDVDTLTAVEDQEIEGVQAEAQEEVVDTVAEENGDVEQVAHEAEIDREVGEGVGEVAVRPPPPQVQQIVQVVQVLPPPNPPPLPAEAQQQGQHIKQNIEYIRYNLPHKIKVRASYC